MASNNCCGGLQDDTVGGDGGSNIDGDNGDVMYALVLVVKTMTMVLIVDRY